MLLFYKETKVGFYYGGLLFFLVICLKMECDKKSFLDTKEIVKQELELRQKIVLWLLMMKMKKLYYCTTILIIISASLGV